jgi:hypothetical protein
MTYRFRVGLCPLDPVQQLLAGSAEFVKTNPQIFLLGHPTLGPFIPFTIRRHETPSHAAFLLNTDLFEYGSDGWQRRREAKRDTKFDWEKLGSKVNGSTYTSPDDLERIIRDSKQWDKGTYSLVCHNCHHFVKFCLESVGAGFFYQNYNHRYLTLTL